MKQLFSWCRVTLIVFITISFSLSVPPSTVSAQEYSSDDIPVPELSIQTLADVSLNHGDLADIHFPLIPSQLRSAFANTFPIVALLQGANVDKSQYKPFARRLARRGFVVVVPNHLIVLGPPGTSPSLFSTTGVIKAVVEKIISEDGNPTSPLRDIVDTNSLALVGHSFGGVVGLLASADVCGPLFCDIFPPPLPPLFPTLKAAVFYGTDLVSFPPAPTSLSTNVPVALIRGSRDSRSTLAESDATYNLLTPRPIRITIYGANHYGICKDNNPMGAIPDPNSPTLPQSESISLAAKWAALWLRATVTTEAMAKFKIYGLIPSDDEDTVLVQTN